MNIPISPVITTPKKSSRYARPKRNNNIPPVMENMLLQAKKDFEQGKGFTRLHSPKDIEAWLDNA